MHIIDYLISQQKDSKTLASLWATFEAKLLNPHIHDLQRAAMKLAFYSGAGCLMHMLEKEIVKGQQTEEEATEFVASLEGEVREFVKQTDRKKQ